MQINKSLYTLGIAAAGSAFTLGLSHLLGWNDERVFIQEAPSQYGNFASEKFGATSNVDFVLAAEKTTQSVVHIRAKQVVSGRQSMGGHPFQDFFGDDFFEQFFQFRGGGGGRQQESESSGSGVIVSADGYIVTNNHVIENASEIEVVMHDKRTFKAQIVGADPSTDLALLKVEDKELPFIVFSNSDNVKVGEWVLAVGNPFNLASTVTAGIVSAKGRNINILKDRAAIESFIQTDAAVNPGNSGGALVNTKGELIGINTAIATPTGTYAGYAFAVPVNIVKKVIDDLQKFGTVKRALLGVSFRELDGTLAKELKVSITEGVYVDNVLKKGSADEAGIKNGDIITKIDGNKIHSSAELQENIGRHSPGDKAKLTIIRDGKEKEVLVTLKSKDDMEGEEYADGGGESSTVLTKLGVKLRQLSDREVERFGGRGGVSVEEIAEGTIARNTNIREGFIITKVGGETVKTVSDFTNKVSKLRGNGVMIEGFYPEKPRETYYYAFGM